MYNYYVSRYYGEIILLIFIIIFIDLRTYMISIISAILRRIDIKILKYNCHFNFLKNFFDRNYFKLRAVKMIREDDYNACVESQL